MADNAAKRGGSSPVLLGRSSASSRSARGNASKQEQAIVDRPGSGDSVRSVGKLIAEKNSTLSGSRPPRPSANTAAAKPRANATNVAQAEQYLLQSQSVEPPQANQSVAQSSSRSSRAAPRRSASNPTKSKLTINEPEHAASEIEPNLVIDRAIEESRRAELVSALAKMPYFDPSHDPRAFHGRAFCLNGTDPPALPEVAWKSSKKPREGSPDWLTATEYAERPEVLHAKVKMLASLLRASRRSLAYTGAGLSVAAGIGMAAVGSKGGAGTGMGVATAGEPTISHCVMAELNRQNLLHGWVQQNHDGLPQKAGYRQEDINEIHGSWFDPSNPVVKYSGTLRGDLFTDMETQAESSDLVIVLGTSLTGLNADQCVTKTASRSVSGNALGSVIISPQRTAQDGKASLRIFAKADDVMRALASEFGFGPRAFGRGRGVTCSADLFPKQQRVRVPYDRHGRRSDTVTTYWDLSRGQKIRLSTHNNIDGANQPNDAGITSRTVGTVMGRDAKTCSITLNINGVNKKLGLWWLETAMRGGLEYLPIVNVDVKEMSA